MKNRLRFDLGALASIEYQRRFIVRATKDSYILPHELLDSATNAAEVTLAQPMLSRAYDSEDLDALRNFLQVTDAAVPTIPPDLPLEELIEANAGWSTVRTAAHAVSTHSGLR